MRTYSHTLLTFAAARSLKPDNDTFAAWAALGATLPDLPVGVGAAWLRIRRRYTRETFLEEVCGRDTFRRPDAALHSVIPVAVTLVLYATLGIRESNRPRAALPLLLGWAGHVVADTLTHASDARPLLWPVSNWRFESPISYRERERHGRPFMLVEHALLLGAVVRMLRR